MGGQKLGKICYWAVELSLVAGGEHEKCLSGEQISGHSDKHVVESSGLAFHPT